MQASLSQPAEGNVIGAFVQRNCCFHGHGIRQQESLVTGTQEVPCLPADFYIPKERAHQQGETSALLMGLGQGGSGRVHSDRERDETEIKRFDSFFASSIGKVILSQ